MSDINTTEELVYITKNTSGNTYHTNPDCRYIKGTPRERRRTTIEAWGYTECSLCKNGPSETYGQDEERRAYADAIRDHQRNE